jgi:hypothetical protein
MPVIKSGSQVWSVALQHQPTEFCRIHVVWITGSCSFRPPRHRNLSLSCSEDDLFLKLRFFVDTCALWRLHPKTVSLRAWFRRRVSIRLYGVTFERASFAPSAVCGSFQGRRCCFTHCPLPVGEFRWPWTAHSPLLLCVRHSGISLYRTFLIFRPSIS